MATYLVTGGAGFIGSHVVEELVSRGEQVRVVDSLVTGRRDNLAHVPGVDLTVGDLADSAVADRATLGVDYVVHLAAIPSVPRSVAEPIATNRANVTGTLSLFVAAQRHAVKRVVFASSSSVYGNAATLPKQEDMAPAPLSPGSSQRSVQLRPVYMANKSSINSDLRGWRTPSVSGEELQTPGVRPTGDGGIARGLPVPRG